MKDRRPYQRESESRRRDDLITAATSLLAEGGAQTATVRAIAARAGVTAGLIRHYFSSKEDLTRAAYSRLMEQMIAKSAQAITSGSGTAHGKLALFVASSVSPPVVDAVAIAVWATFVHEVGRDPEMREAHHRGYLSFRNLLQELIIEAGFTGDARQAAIACNGLIDGLWMEASLLPETFGAGEIVEIALKATGAILAMDLLTAYNKETGL